MECAPAPTAKTNVDYQVKCRLSGQNLKYWSENYHRWHELEDDLRLRDGENSRPPVSRTNERRKTPEAKSKDEEHSIVPSSFQVWSSHQEQTQEAGPKSLDKRAPEETLVPWTSKQSVGVDAPGQWGMAGRNTRYHPRHSRHPSKGVSQGRRAEVTDPWSYEHRPAICHLG